MHHIAAVALLPALLGGILLDTPAARAEAVSVILDTDIGPDCDDVAALVLLHGAATRGEARLLATICCISSEWGAPCLDAINTYFGRPEIAVGTLKDPGFLDGKSYNQEIARRFPHALKSGKDAPDATAVYRRVLVGQPDASVVVVAIGPLRNLGKLLQSSPDAASPLSGRDLVAKKVKSLVCMGGNYPAGAEWNFQQDVGAAKLVCEEWPTPITFSGGEIGGGICTGRRVALEGAEHHPLTMAFANYPGVGFGGDRLSWDPTACLYAVRGHANYWKVVTGGTNEVGDKGRNTWRPAPDKGRGYLVKLMPTSELEAALEDLMVAAKPGPLDFGFNAAYYVRDGMGLVTARGEASPGNSKEKVFDRNPRSLWQDDTVSSWIQIQDADGRKYAVSSYAVTVGDKPECFPKGLALSGSNDGGATWDALDTRQDEVFGKGFETREFSVKKPAPYNAYRLQVSSAGQAVQLAELELIEHVENTSNVPVAGLVLDRKAVEVPVDGRAALNVDFLPGNAANKSVMWASSDASIAIVRRIGKNTAIVAGKREGSCSVTVATEDGRQSATCQVTVKPSSLPAPWTFREINEPFVPGAVAVAGGEFMITGGGEGVRSWWERVKDQFVLVGRPVAGDCRISARVTALTDNGRTSDSKSIAGLMLRESTYARSKYFMVFVTPAGDLVCSWRDKTDQETDFARQSIKLGKVTLPVHVRIERKGDVLNVYKSSDGNDWGIAIGTHAMTFKDPSQAGLFVTSANNATTSTARFDNVSLQESPSGAGAP